jgi:hypothetical protein
MTARVIAIIAGLAACWIAGVLGGIDAARWCAGGCVVLVTLVLRALTPPQDTPRTPRYGAGRTVVRHAYPRYHRLTSMVLSASADRRYYDRVLTPLLDKITAEVDDPAPVDAVRADVAEELGRFERKHRSWT